MAACNKCESDNLDESFLGGLLAVVTGVIGIKYNTPELTKLIGSAITAFAEREMMRETQEALTEIACKDNTFGDELWAKEKQNQSWRDQYYSTIWNAEGEVEYQQCDGNKTNRALLEQRHRNAMVRDTLLDNTTMYSVGMRKDIINRHLARDTLAHGQSWIAAKWHEENHTLDANTKYYALVMSMVKGVPYGQLPAFLGKVGSAYEGLLRMHSTSVNTSIGLAVGAFDKMVNYSDDAKTSFDKRDEQQNTETREYTQYDGVTRYEPVPHYQERYRRQINSGFGAKPNGEADSTPLFK